MTDQVRVPVGLTPQQLLVRSNPAMYPFERELTRDLTNPREMYSLLAHNTKSTEDLTAKFKQEIVQNIQSAGGLPKLSRATSLNEIRRIPHGKSDKLGKFQSATDILNSGKKLNVLVLTHNRTSLEGFRTITEEEKENVHAVNLPNISHNTVSHRDINAKDRNKNTVTQAGLPTLLRNQNVENKEVVDINDVQVKSGTTKSNNLKNSKVFNDSDPKLEKWFSEMPNEVFDKAQRAIMEASIKEKLIKYQYKRNRKENFPAHVNVLHGSRLRKVPNTFLEVRVDSFGKHLKNEGRLNKYKLQQKSMHKLKMREMEEIERQERTVHEDVELTPRLKLQYRSHTTMTFKNKADLSHEKEQPNDTAGPVEKSMKTFDINEALNRDILPRERTGVNNYQDYADRLYLSKSAHDTICVKDGKESEKDTCPKPNSLVSKESEVEANKAMNIIDHGGGPKTKVVNIALETDTFRPPKSLHTDMTAHARNANENDINIEENTHEDDDKDDVNETNNPEGENKCAENTGDMKDDNVKCIANIPTARSSRTSDSNRSTISSKYSPKPNKSVLRKFNKLEVFAEHGKVLDAKMARQSYHGHKLRDHDSKGTPVTAPYKLDLKSYPQHFKNPVPEHVGLVRPEVRKQDLIFHFEPGEVFVTRKSQPNTYRVSERARIIYGKIATRDDRAGLAKGFDAKLAKDSSSVHSLSTRLEGYKYEMGSFENRALADSIPSDSAREQHLDNEEYTYKPDLDGTSTITKTPLERYNKFGKAVRDIAVETDILGSDTGSPRKKDSFEIDDMELQQVKRPDSNLSDFIIENNDGESLNSDSEIDEMVRDSVIRKSRSTQKSRATQSNLSGE